MVRCVSRVADGGDVQDPTYTEKETELRELIEDKVKRILSKEKVGPCSRATQCES